MISAMVLKMGLAFMVVLYFLFTLLQMTTWKVYSFFNLKIWFLSGLAGFGISFILLNWRAFIN